MRTHGRGTVNPFFHVNPKPHPQVFPDSLRFSIMDFAMARVPGSVAITSRVACVRTLMGLKQRLPHSFTQISLRISDLTVT